MFKWDRYYILHFGVLALFMGTLGYVTFRAYSRQSGALGLNMVKIQQIRYEAFQDSKK